MAITQVRSFGAGTGRRYGSFEDKGGGTHPVGRLTQARSFGAHAGSRYASFAGRGEQGHPVSRLTQVRAFGAHTGGRYGAFFGKSQIDPPEPPTPIPGGGRYVVEIPKGIAARTIEEQDELLLLLSTCRGQIIQADL